MYLSWIYWLCNWLNNNYKVTKCKINKEDREGYKIYKTDYKSEK